MTKMGIQCYYESSAKSAHNIDNIMEHLAAKIIENCVKNQKDKISKINDYITLNKKTSISRKNNSEVSGKCCH